VCSNTFILKHAYFLHINRLNKIQITNKKLLFFIAVYVIRPLKWLDCLAVFSAMENSRSGKFIEALIRCMRISINNLYSTLTFSKNKLETLKEHNKRVLHSCTIIFWSGAFTPGNSPIRGLQRAFFMSRNKPNMKGAPMHVEQKIHASSLRSQIVCVTQFFLAPDRTTPVTTNFQLSLQ
jgi:hypothetical protein